MRCIIPNDRGFTWRYKWFRDFQQLSYVGEELSLLNAKLKDSGKYQCRGVADTHLGDLESLLSLPVEITVDGKILPFFLFIFEINKTLNSLLS